MIRTLRLCLLTMLIGSFMQTTGSFAMQTTGPFACSYFASITPQFQELVPGSSATVEITANTCGGVADAVIFEIHGPHPTVQTLDSNGGQFNHTYEGVSPGLDELSVTLFIGREILRGEAQVSWGPVVPEIHPDTVEDIAGNGLPDCTTVLMAGEEPPQDPVCSLVIQYSATADPLDEDGTVRAAVGHERTPYAWSFGDYAQYGTVRADGSIWWIGQVHLDAKIDLNGRNSQWNMGADPTSGPSIKASLAWHCRDSRDISCSTGGSWETVESPSFRFDRFGHGDSVIHNLNIRYWYWFFYAWKATGHGPNVWYTPRFDSHDFSCRSGVTAGPCRFYW